MICETIIKANSLPSCVGMLTIGTISDHNSNVEVILANNATGRKDSLTATSDNSGLVVVDLTEYSLLPLSTYSVKIKKDGEYKEITIDTFTGESIIFSVELVNGVAVDDYTLTSEA